MGIEANISGNVNEAQVRIVPMDDNYAHVQARGTSEGNRAYGSSVEIPHTTEFGAFIQELAIQRVGPVVRSLAGSDMEYVPFRYRVVDDTTVEVEFPAQSLSYFARPWYSQGAFRFVFTEVSPDITRLLV